MRASPARYINIVLGVWLFISAFAWEHTSAQFTNAWLVGLLIAACAAAATRIDGARYLNTILAVWLFLSNWIIPTQFEGTVWNNILVSIAVLVLSLAGNRFFERPAAPTTRPRPAPGM
jgi:hypothetical protein